MHGHPNEFELFVVFSVLFVLIIYSGKKKCVVPHLCQEHSIGFRVPEWISLPPNSRSNPKFSQNKVVTHHHIIQQVVEVRTSLIVNGPATTDEFKSALVDKIFNCAL